MNPPDRVDLAALAAGFAARLRSAGLPVGPARTNRCATAGAAADPVTVPELYWCAAVTLVGDPAELPAFNRIFGLVFGGVPAAPPGDTPTPPLRPDAATGPPPPTATPRPGGIERGAADGDEEEAVPSLAATAERLGPRDFASLTPDELRRLIGLMRQLRLATPLRRSRRFESGSRGPRTDLRRTMRLAQRTGGFPTRLARHRVRLKHRRLVVLCDISGSMEPYARALLQLLYSAVAVAGPRTEVFTFATRLTRLTRVLARVRPEVAIANAGRAAPDWSGGTRIGEALKVFLDRYGAQGLARGAVILIISDGWETGDANVLRTQMVRLARLSYRIVWANPRTASPRYEPLVAGMAAAWPYCDRVVSANSLSALDELISALAEPRP